MSNKFSAICRINTEKQPFQGDLWDNAEKQPFGKKQNRVQINTYTFSFKNNDAKKLYDSN